jgi:Fe2+ transport system protein B
MGMAFGTASARDKTTRELRVLVLNAMDRPAGASRPNSRATSQPSIGAMIAQSWSLATAFSLLAWYVFAPQCISTLSIVRRETNSMRYPLIMAGYLFLLAYVASFITYRVALVLTGS